MKFDKIYLVIIMKVLTIKQPWATLIMQGDKKYEFRSWQTKHRGELLIHAGKGIDKEAVKRLKQYLPDKLPQGLILGKVKIVDCIKCDEILKTKCQKENKDIYPDNIFNDGYAWQIEEVEVFEKTIEAKGKLSLWDYQIK